MFSEVNEIQDRGYIIMIVDGKQVEIELFLGGDYKVIGYKSKFKLDSLK